MYNNYVFIKTSINDLISIDNVPLLDCKLVNAFS